MTPGASAPSTPWSSGTASSSATTPTSPASQGWHRACPTPSSTGRAARRRWRRFRRRLRPAHEGPAAADAAGHSTPAGRRTPGRPGLAVPGPAGGGRNHGPVAELCRGRRRCPARHPGRHGQPPGPAAGSRPAPVPALGRGRDLPAGGDRADRRRHAPRAAGCWTAATWPWARPSTPSGSSPAWNRTRPGCAHTSSSSSPKAGNGCPSCRKGHPLAHLHRHRLPQRNAGRKDARLRQRGLRRHRNLRTGPAGLPCAAPARSVPWRRTWASPSISTNRSGTSTECLRSCWPTTSTVPRPSSA